MLLGVELLYLKFALNIGAKRPGYYSKVGIEFGGISTAGFHGFFRVPPATDCLKLIFL